MQAMELVNRRVVNNPLADLIGDEVYEILQTRNLLNDKSVRDHTIRKRFWEMRTRDISAQEAIGLLREEYPYLQFDTIRKIVYKQQPNR